MLRSLQSGGLPRRMSLFARRAVDYAADASPAETAKATVAAAQAAAAALPEVPMPSPVAGAGVPPVQSTPLPVTRAPVLEAGDPGQAAWFRAEPAEPQGLPPQAQVTAWAWAPDGMRYFAVAQQGVFAVRGDHVRRYVSLSLVPRQETVGLVLDGQDRPVITGDGAVVRRWTGDRWAPLRVTDSPGARVVGLGADSAGRVVALVETTVALPATPEAATPGAATPEAATPEAATPATPSRRLVLVREDGDRFAALGSHPVPREFEGPVRAGTLVVDARGEVLAPLFWRDDKGQLRGAGLGRFFDGGAGFEVWKGRLGFDEEGLTGPPLLPDAWVNDVARNAAGVTWVATNAGLVRVAGGRIKVFDENDFIDSEVMTALALGADGRVWAGTLEGLGYVAADRWKAIKRAPFDGRIGGLAIGHDGKVWVATDDGLFRGDGTVWERVPVGAGVPVGGVRDIVMAKDGGLWLLTEQGVLRFQPGG